MEEKELLKKLMDDFLEEMAKHDKSARIMKEGNKLLDYCKALVHSGTLMYISDEKKDRIIAFELEIGKLIEEFMKAEGIEYGNKID